jgi:hypothetical protein
MDTDKCAEKANRRCRQTLRHITRTKQERRRGRGVEIERSRERECERSALAHTADSYTPAAVYPHELEETCAPLSAPYTKASAKPLVCVVPNTTLTFGDETMARRRKEEEEEKEEKDKAEEAEEEKRKDEEEKVKEREGLTNTRVMRIGILYVYVYIYF